MVSAALIARSHLGFTLLELIVTVLMLSILLGIAAPNVYSLIENNRATAAANKLVASLNGARTNAVSRRRNVTVCTSGNGATCRTGADADYKNWHGGWLTKLDATGEVLEVADGLVSTFQLTSAFNALQFDASGATTAGAIVQFDLTIPTCTGDKEREIQVSTTGRISVDRTACP
jgi:type IV fimbrial biogenesis protein FimT